MVLPTSNIQQKGPVIGFQLLDNQFPFIFTSVAEPEVHLMVTMKNLVSRVELVPVNTWIHSSEMVPIYVTVQTASSRGQPDEHVSGFSSSLSHLLMTTRSQVLNC